MSSEKEPPVFRPKKSSPRNAQLAAIWSTRKFLLECDLRIEEECSEYLNDYTYYNEINMSPYEYSLYFSTQDALCTALKKLKPIDAQSLVLYFGLGGDEMTLEQVAQKFDVTRERIRQRVARGLRILRKHMKRSDYFN